MAIRCNHCFEEYDEHLDMCPYCGREQNEKAAEAFCLAPGTVIANRYIIGEMLGLGGFGITYKAWDQKLNIKLAIKEFYPSGLVNRLPGNPNIILVATKREREFVYGKTRFLEEARNMAKFSSHKNIVNVFDFFEANNTAYIVMEYLDGKTLTQTLQAQNVPLPSDYCVKIASDVCAALRSIHGENILHRDVSPDNIMLCKDGTVKLFDFGAARFSAGIENRVTVVVKPGFAPPEQYDKVNRQDPRTDIYALGATLYYALTGVKPEESTNRKIQDTLVDPIQIDSTIPASVNAAIMRAMAVEQQYRFSNVDEFEKALLSGKTVLTPEEEKKKRKRRRLITIILSFAVVAVAVSTLFYILNWQKEEYDLEASLDVWYIQTNDAELNRAKELALAGIAQSFTEDHEKVDVNLIPVDEAGYAKKLDQAVEDGNLPAVFESTGVPLDETGLTFDSTSVVQNDEGGSFATPKMASPAKSPCGIIAPIIYINKAKGQLSTADSLEEIAEECEAQGLYFEISKDDIDMYAVLYGIEAANYSTDSALDHFLSRESFAYFGDSSDYLQIQKTLPGEYACLVPDTGKSTYRYGMSWSMGAKQKGEVKAAEAFMAYLSGSLAQEYFWIRNHGGNLPILKSSLEDYLEVYSEIGVLKDYLAMPFEAPLQDVSSILKGADTSQLEVLKEAASKENASEDVEESSTAAMVIDQSRLDETYWSISFGQTIGANYAALFHLDNTVSLCSRGSMTFETCEYECKDGHLYLPHGDDAIDFIDDGKDGFVSVEKYPMQVGEDYYRITPDEQKSYAEYLKQSNAASEMADGEYLVDIFPGEIHDNGLGIVFFASLSEVISFSDEYVQNLKVGDVIELSQYGYRDAEMEHSFQDITVTKLEKVESASGYIMMYITEGSPWLTYFYDQKEWHLVSESDYVWRSYEEKVPFMLPEDAIIMDDYTPLSSGKTVYGKKVEAYISGSEQLNDIRDFFAFYPNVTRPKIATATINNGKVESIKFLYEAVW